jgi:hypothetical protein
VDDEVQRADLTVRLLKDRPHLGIVRDVEQTASRSASSAMFGVREVYARKLEEIPPTEMGPEVETPPLEEKPRKKERPKKRLSRSPAAGKR